MEEIKKVILVPWDFTEGCKIALEHAIQLAKVGNNEIMLLHLIPRKFASLSRGHSLAEIENINKKIDADVVEIEQKFFVTPRTMVLEGKPKKVLQDLILTANINLVIAYHTYVYKSKRFKMTDWLKKLVFKEITLPFIVINKKPLHNHYIEICIPVYSERRFKETVHWIIHLAKYYKCNVNFVKPFLIDEYKKRQLASNIYFTKKMLDGVGIVYGIKTAKKTDTFENEVFKFAANIEADLILIMTDKYDQLMGKKKSSDLAIPIMCVNNRIRKFQSFN